ncbi:MAG: ABC transporter ATP-binding protein [Fusobacteriota bacterium]
MALVKMKGVKKIYNQGKIEVPALRGIDLTFEKGEFSSIAGPSGSGKTTLLNMIGCLDKPTEGSLYFDGTEIENLDKDELAMLRRHNLGFIFQSYNLIPVFTAFENVEIALRLIEGISKKEIKERTLDILESVGLKDYINRKPNELSGGQKQRVSIARALVKKPKLVLADEPTANLDSETSEDVLEVMKKMNEKYHTTFLFSTHDPQVMNYARRLLTIKDGKITDDKENN